MGKLNVMAAQHKIQGAPTFIVFASGEVRGRRTGAQSERQLENLLEEAGVFDSKSEVTEEQDEEQDEEEIRKRLQALGYVE
jgi:thioredoxin-like negative regulator of GroEL